MTCCTGVVVDVVDDEDGVVVEVVEDEDGVLVEVVDDEDPMVVEVVDEPVVVDVVAPGEDVVVESPIEPSLVVELVELVELVDDSPEANVPSTVPSISISGSSTTKGMLVELSPESSSTIVGSVTDDSTTFPRTMLTAVHENARANIAASAHPPIMRVRFVMSKVCHCECPITFSETLRV